MRLHFGRVVYVMNPSSIFVTTSWSFGNASYVTQHQGDVCVPRVMNLERIIYPLMLG